MGGDGSAVGGCGAMGRRRATEVGGGDKMRVVRRRREAVADPTTVAAGGEEEGRHGEISPERREMVGIAFVGAACWRGGRRAAREGERQERHRGQ